MIISHRVKNDFYIVDIEAEIVDASSADYFKKYLTAFSKKEKILIVNLTKINHIDSMCIGILLEINKNIESRDGKLIIYGVNDNIKKIFSIVGFSEIVEITETETQALLKGEKIIKRIENSENE